MENITDQEAMLKVLVALNAYPDGVNMNLPQFFRQEVFKSYDAVYEHLIREMENNGWIILAPNTQNHKITIEGRNAIANYI